MCENEAVTSANLRHGETEMPVNQRQKNSQNVTLATDSRLPKVLLYAYQDAISVSHLRGRMKRWQQMAGAS